MHRAFFLGIVYFHFGRMLRLNEERILHNYLFGIACILFIVINVIDQQCLWFVENYQSQGNYILNLLFSLSGTYILYYILSRLTLSFFSKGVAVIGKYSMVIFATHRPLLGYVYEPLSLYFFPNIEYGAFLGFAIFFLLIMAYMVYMILHNMLPIVVGVK